MVLDRGSNTQLTIEGGLEDAYPKQQPQASTYQSETLLQTNIPDSHSVPFPTTPYSDPYVGEPSNHAAAGPSYQPPRIRTPPPPPPPSNVGYIPTFLPRNDDLPPCFTDMPPLRAAPRQRGPPGFTMGLGAGALAAGAVIFGDDFMSGFDVPPGLGDASLTEEIDPPF